MIVWVEWAYGNGASARAGTLKLSVGYDAIRGGGYHASSGDQRLTARFATMDEAKAAAIRLAKKQVAEAAKILENA